MIGITHAELILRGVRWLKWQKHYRYRSPIIITELVTYAKETPDIMGLNHFHTTVIECKVSLADFAADLKKRHRNHVKSLGNWRFYLCPKDLIPLDLVPDDWGLLYAEEKQIKVIKHPQDHYESEVRAEEYHILYSIARRATVMGLMKRILEPLSTPNKSKERPIENPSRY